MEEKVTAEQLEKAKTAIKNIFIIRATLWVIALGATIYWIAVEYDLRCRQFIFDPYEFAGIFRPIFYTCLVITIVAIVISFILRKITLEIKRQNGIR